jgi:indole-3-glycerol phosphate synthase
MTILDKIAEERRSDVKKLKGSVAEADLIELAAGRTHHSLSGALSTRSGRAVVAEIKKASPSAGVIKDSFDPEAIARSYIDCGASGISVLTEPRHFMGSPEHLKAVRAATDLPILRKDFMVDPYQVLEAAAWGADVVLIIMAMLDSATIKDIYDCAASNGLEVLVESHNEAELEAAAGLPEAILGINNRDLKTLKTSLEPSRRLASLIPQDRLSMAESGISSMEEIAELASLGYDGFLIGESLLNGKLSLK